MGDPAAPPQKKPAQFLAHVCCGQTAARIKMPLGTEVVLGSDDIVLDGHPPPHKGVGAPSPIFGPWLLWPNGWMDQDGTSASRWALVHATLCYIGTQLPSPKGGRALPNFRPIFIVTKRLDASRCHLVWR